MKDFENLLKSKTDKKIKEDIFNAQKMYCLCQKYDKRIPAYIREFCKNTLNKYIKIAKNAELQLSTEELYDRLLDK